METEFSQSSPLSVLLPPCLWPEGPQERGVPTFLSPSTSGAQEAVSKGLVNEKWAGEGEEMEREGRTTSEGGLAPRKRWHVAVTSGPVIAGTASTVLVFSAPPRSEGAKTRRRCSDREDSKVAASVA